MKLKSNFAKYVVELVVDGAAAFSGAGAALGAIRSGRKRKVESRAHRKSLAE